MSYTRRLPLLAAAAAALFAGHAAAQSGGPSPQTANLAVSAAVTNNCLITTTALAFGNYNPIDPATVPGTGTISLRCTRGAIPSVALDNGLNPLVAQRRMALGAERLAYNLFRPVSNAAGAACPAVGAGTAWNATAFALTAAPTSAARVYNVCGELPGAQDVPAGTYTDTVVATVTF